MLSDHYYCPSDDNGCSTSSDEDESSIDSNMPGLQPREAEFSSSSEDEDTIASGDSDNDDDHDDASIQGSISGDCSNGFALDAFDLHNTIPLSTSTHMVPPVSCVVIPNDENDVNASTSAPITKRVDPAGRIPIRVQQDCFAHVDDVICHKPSLPNIGGEPIHNWAQFVDTRRSFPTQVSINHQVMLDSGAITSIMPTLPHLFFCYLPKRTGVIRSRPSQLDPPDFQQGEN
jgi:hypothetical protein